MASNPGRIPAGGRDKISVEISTRNRGGGTLRKRFTVYTDDPSKPQAVLTVTGKVKGYLTVDPAYIRLVGPAGDAVSSEVQITPLEGYSFAIKEIQAQQGDNLRFQVKPEGSKRGQRGYLLLVENTKKEAGSYNDMIIIKTDSKQKPELRIPVFARLYKPNPVPGEPKSK